MYKVNRRVIRCKILFCALVFSISVMGNANANQILTESNKNRLVKVRIGESFSVQLHSTYWSFDSIKGKSIKAIGTTKVAPIMPGPNAPAGCQVAGMGCGTVSLKFKAINKGISTVNASRTSCGEALRCTPAQSNYHVTIKVN